MRKVLVFAMLMCAIKMAISFPSHKTVMDLRKRSVQDSNDIVLPNEIILVEDTTQPKSNCNRTLNYAAILKTIQRINELRSKSLQLTKNESENLVTQTTGEATSTEKQSHSTPETTSYETTLTSSMSPMSSMSTTTSATTSADMMTTDLPAMSLDNMGSTMITALMSDKENAENSTAVRPTRQETRNRSQPVMFENQEDGDAAGIVGAIISGFLGSLSKPDGAVDIDQVVSVIGMLSAAQEDGSYDFKGLTETLDAFFGGDEEDGGGSDVASFFGGVAAAFIKGVAAPGAKGAGSFVGRLVKQVLPAISSPQKPAGEGAPNDKSPQVDAGGFLGGLLDALFGDGTRPATPFLTIKSNLFRFAFSALSSVLGSSSSGSSGGSGAPNKLMPSGKLKYPKA